MAGKEDRRGYIALYRSILDWEWYSDPNTCRVFLHLLLTAYYEDTPWRGITLKRGSREISLTGLATECALTVRQARTALKHLEMTGEVTRQKMPQTTVITIKNYDHYQDATRQVTRKRHTANENGDTASDGVSDTLNDNLSLLINKEINKPPISPKGDGDVFEKYSGGDADLLEALRAFEKMRVRIKKPMTDVARKRLTQKLDKLVKEHPSLDKVDVLEEAVLHCWQSVYLPKDESKQNEEDDSNVL